MKVSELKRILEHSNPENEVNIVIKLPYQTVGAIPMVAVKSAQTGFDWENGKLMIYPLENLTPQDRNFAEQMKSLQDRLGWAEYENRNLKSEVSRLLKQLIEAQGLVKMGNDIDEKGYQESTHEKQQEFSRKRNYHLSNTDNPIDFPREEK